MKTLAGCTKFTVQNGSVALINRLSKFKLTNITLDGEDVLTFTAPLVHKKRIKRLLGKNDYTSMDNKSLPRAISFLYANVFLTCSLMFGMMALIILNNFIFRVNITGLDTEQLTLVKNSLQLPTLKRSLDKTQIATTLTDFPFVAHVHTHIRGNRLIINIYPVETSPEPENKHVVSRFDAVVTNMVILSGLPTFSVGQPVLAGDILIYSEGTRAKGIIHGEVRKSVTTTTTVANKESAIHALYAQLFNDTNIFFTETELFFNPLEDGRLAIELVGIANIVIS